MLSYQRVPIRSLPTFTTADHVWHRQKKRWMTAREKPAALGFPATPSISEIYKVESWIANFPPTKLLQATTNNTDTPVQTKIDLPIYSIPMSLR